MIERRVLSIVGSNLQGPQPCSNLKIYQMFDVQRQHRYNLAAVIGFPDK